MGDDDDDASTFAQSRPGRAAGDDWVVRSEGDAPSDVLTDEELVALDEALVRHGEPWPDEPPDHWPEDREHAPWLVTTARWAVQGVLLRVLAYRGQFVAVLTPAGVALRSPPMFGSPDCVDNGAAGTYDALMRAGALLLSSSGD